MFKTSSMLHYTSKKASKAKFYQDLNKECWLEELLNKVAVKLREQFQVPLTSDIQF